MDPVVLPCCIGCTLTHRTNGVVPMPLELDIGVRVRVMVSSGRWYTCLFAFGGLHFVIFTLLEEDLDSTSESSE